MLHTLRKLAREIHRRSVWQVLAGYLVFWLVGFELVDVLTSLLGLPLWTPTMAFVLLGIGLPVVLATAVAQGGIPGLRIVDVVDPNELEGRTPAEVHVIPERHPLHGTGFLTWRNAILGGVMAAALLVTSVVAYLTMWAFGIGPVGSLAAQGILAPDDLVYVADFENRTDVPGLGVRVRVIMETELGRSTLVDVLERGTVDPLSELPGGAGERVEPDSRARVGVEEAVALRLAARAGARLVVDGEVRPAEVGYRVYARIRLPDGTVLGGFGQTATGQDEIGDQVARLALRLRQRFGESLREIHEDEEIRPAS